MPSGQASAATSTLRQRRKALGAWYTPPALVAHVVQMTLPSDTRALTVLDPACGDGRFLEASSSCVQHRDGRLGMTTTTGVEIDPAAANAARARVPGAEVIDGDALALDWGERTFDVVVGNPPFRNQLATLTSRGGRSRFGGGPYADTAAEFLALALRLARPDGGRVGLVLPQSILTSRDVAPIRRAAAQTAALASFWSSSETLFDASVRTCVLVFERGARQGPIARWEGPSFASRPPAALGDSWGSLLLDGAAPAADATARTLGDVASFAADFRNQYYGLIGAVRDDADGPPLVTSGLIDPGRCLWGTRPVRFAKQHHAAPRVDLAVLTPALQRWAATRLVPKILIANQTRRIEAVIDRDGAWLPSVPVITCTTEHLDEVFAVLSSPAATTWAQHRAAGSGLSANAIRLSPALLASIPF